MRTYEVYLGDTRRNETNDRYYVQRVKFGMSTLWDGIQWSDHHKWDYSDSKDFVSHEAAYAFVYECIMKDLMLGPLGGFCKFGVYRVRPKKEHPNATTL
jgi:hypothetical protein